MTSHIHVHVYSQRHTHTHAHTNHTHTHTHTHTCTHTHMHAHMHTHTCTHMHTHTHAQHACFSGCDIHVYDVTDYGAGQDAAGVRGEGLEICGHVGEATRDVCLQYNVASHDAIRHKWSGPNNGECCCVDDGDVGERQPIGTGGHTACIALGGAASVVSHQTDKVEGGGGEARDCSLKVGSTAYHCGLRCSNRRSSACRPHSGYIIPLGWAGGSHSK